MTVKDQIHAAVVDLVRPGAARRRARRSPWTDTTLVQEALEVLHEQVSRHRLPLVFSDGDYNPLLRRDG